VGCGISFPFPNSTEFGRIIFPRRQNTRRIPALGARSKNSGRFGLVRGPHARDEGVSEHGDGNVGQSSHGAAKCAPPTGGFQPIPLETEWASLRVQEAFSSLGPSSLFFTENPSLGPRNHPHAPTTFQRVHAVQKHSPIPAGVKVTPIFPLSPNFTALPCQKYRQTDISCLNHNNFSAKRLRFLASLGRGARGCQRVW
jgi:hypothetical protein